MKWAGMGAIAVLIAVVGACDSPARTASPTVSPRVTTTASGSPTDQPRPTTSTTGATGSGTPTRPSTSSSSPKPARTPRGSELIAKVEIVTIDGRRTVEITPTEDFREHHDDVATAAAWREVVRRQPAADTSGMHDQFVCHVLFAPRKSVWHIEKWRPDVGYLATVTAACNPGPIKDPDQAP